MNAPAAQHGLGKGIALIVLAFLCVAVMSAFGKAAGGAEDANLSSTVWALAMPDTTVAPRAVKAAAKMAEMRIVLSPLLVLDQLSRVYSMGIQASC